MIRFAVAGLLALAVSVHAAEPPAAPLEPAQAIAAVGRSPGGVRGTFAMTVRAYRQEGQVLYLNSTTDYRAADNVTFQLPVSAIGPLERMAGASLSAIVGRRVIVQGYFDRLPVYRMKNGRPVAFDRVQHIVKLRQSKQLVAVE